VKRHVIELNGFIYSGSSPTFKSSKQRKASEVGHFDKGLRLSISLFINRGINCAHPGNLACGPALLHNDPDNWADLVGDPIRRTMLLSVAEPVGEF